MRDRVFVGFFDLIQKRFAADQPANAVWSAISSMSLMY